MGRFAFLVIAIAIVVAAMMPGRLAPPPKQASLSAPVAPVTDAYRVETPADGMPTNVPRQTDGHFYVDAEVNGTRIHFLIDTGSTTVALTEDDARRAGIV